MLTRKRVSAGSAVARLEGVTTEKDTRATIRTTFEQASYPAGDDPVVRMLVEASVDAPATVSSCASRRPRVELFLVLDVSGSMDEPDRYPLLRRALTTLLEQVEPDDRVGVAVFADGGDRVLSLTPGAIVRQSVGDVLARMDASPRKFGGATLLGCGLDLAREALSAPADDAMGCGGGSSDRRRAERRAAGVRRLIVLTDGEVHDADACALVLPRLRSLGVEVAAYGFGARFDAASLRALLSDQLGGWVKPICRLEDIVATFGHVADVTSRLVASGGLMVVELDAQVDVGDAWTFRPHERYLGPVHGRRLVRELGGVEAERSYSLFLELRVPPHDAPSTRLGTAALRWQSGDPMCEERVILSLPRSATQEPGPPCPRVAEVAALLEALRQPHAQAVRLRAAQARLELARAEGRDPGLLEALRKQIEVLEGRTTPSALSYDDLSYIDSDPCTRVSGDIA
jgi:hypothetical protein